LDGFLSDTLTALRLDTPARSETPNHRDYLGSLLSLGIRRELLGDILIGEHTAFVPVMANIADFIISSLERIGGQPVKIEAVPLSDIAVKAREFETIRMTVASLRLDKIAAGGFGVSRTEMADMIRSGLVRVNWREETRPDTDVAIGSVISLSGYGRIRLVSEEGLSRKERHILIVEKYR
jgi:RNA-binding protein YlmH